MPLRKRKIAKPLPSPALPKPQVRLNDEMGSSSSNVFLRQPVWIVLSVSSGACAALNGVFAKLTTTSSTSTIAARLAGVLSLSDKYVKLFEIVIRGSFFGLNLLFNAIMWALFTAALTRATSTTRVSIINVSANFFVTAVAGWLIFGEDLKGLWWLGAALLVVGNVVIGRREEGEKPGGTVGLDETTDEAEALMGSDARAQGDQQEDLLELGDQGRPGDHSRQANGSLGIHSMPRPRSPYQRQDSHADDQARMREGIEVDAPI